jgi:hypothetical protein
MGAQKAHFIIVGLMCHDLLYIPADVIVYDFLVPIASVFGFGYTTEIIKINLESAGIIIITRCWPYKIIGS